MSYCTTIHAIYATKESRPECTKCTSLSLIRSRRSVPKPFTQGYMVDHSSTTTGSKNNNSNNNAVLNQMMLRDVPVFRLPDCINLVLIEHQQVLQNKPLLIQARCKHACMSCFSGTRRTLDSSSQTDLCMRRSCMRIMNSNNRRTRNKTFKSCMSLVGRLYKPIWANTAPGQQQQLRTLSRWTERQGLGSNHKRTERDRWPFAETADERWYHGYRIGLLRWYWHWSVGTSSQAVKWLKSALSKP